MEKNKKRVLLSVYLENNSIEYEFNQTEEEIIIINNLLLYGLLAKIQKNLLDLDSSEIAEEEEYAPKKLMGIKDKEETNGGNGGDSEQDTEEETE